MSVPQFTGSSVAPHPGAREFWVLTIRRDANFGGTEATGPWAPIVVCYAQPPTREDFLALTRRVFWMAALTHDLVPCLDRSQWPIVDWMHKRATTDLLDAEGVVVGQVEVSRDCIHVNEGYSRFRCVVDCEAERRAMSGLPKANRALAKSWILDNVNRAREALLADPATIVDDEARSKVAVRILRKLLRDAGLFKS